MTDLLHSITANEELLLQLVLFSSVIFIASLILIPWLVVRMPADYFEKPYRKPLYRFRRFPALRMVLLVCKNLLGLALLLLGMILLVLPGQGLLTMIMGLVLMDFPGKFRFQRWLVQRRSIFRTLNWLREKGQQKPFRQYHE